MRVRTFWPHFWDFFFQVNLFSSLVCIAIFRFCTNRVMERDKRMNDGSRLSGTWHPLVAKVRTFLKNSTTSVLNELILDLQFFFFKGLWVCLTPAALLATRRKKTGSATCNDRVHRQWCNYRARPVIRCVMSRLEDTPLMLSASQTYDADYSHNSRVGVSQSELQESSWCGFPWHRHTGLH